MRVSDDEARADLYCAAIRSCSDCEHKYDSPLCKIPSCNHTIEDYANDLLEARSIIRDFRRAIKENNLAIDCHCDGCNMIRAAMERSKEYAE
jgi:hypothetical protein